MKSSQMARRQAPPVLNKKVENKRGEAEKSPTALIIRVYRTNSQ
jgi:hypothetical protein